jgi:hypothetical protein
MFYDTHTRQLSVCNMLYLCGKPSCRQDCRHPEHMDVIVVFAVRGFRIPAQICMEQICINPKGVRQDRLT